MGSTWVLVYNGRTMDLPIDPVLLPLEQFQDLVRTEFEQVQAQGPEACLRYLRGILQDTIDLPPAVQMMVFERMAEVQAELGDWDACSASMARAQEARCQVMTEGPRAVVIEEKAPPSAAWEEAILVPGGLSTELAKPLESAPSAQAPTENPKAPVTPSSGTAETAPSTLIAPAQIITDAPEPTPTGPFASIIMQASAFVTPEESASQRRRICRGCWIEVSRKDCIKDPATGTYLCRPCHMAHLRQRKQGKRNRLRVFVLGGLALLLLVASVLIMRM